MESIRSTMGSILMQSGGDTVIDTGSSSSTTTMLSAVPIIVLAAIVVTLLIVVVAALIDNNNTNAKQPQRPKPRNSQRRRSRGALIDFGLLWSTLCAVLTSSKDKDTTVGEQLQTLSAKKLRKCKEAPPHRRSQVVVMVCCYIYTNVSCDSMRRNLISDVRFW